MVLGPLSVLCAEAKEEKKTNGSKCDAHGVCTPVPHQVPEKLWTYRLFFFNLFLFLPDVSSDLGENALTDRIPAGVLSLPKITIM